MLISTKDVGEIAPAPLHATWPEAQSVVAQVNLPKPSVEHPVWPLNRPFHGVGVASDVDAPDASSNPVFDN
ncbi:hypothetical protein FH972_016457 [Carpinus fangiana]|uniref:Uncharacterized protein n=1 Tax=Carpinus fangiana TaxID=176857 RepID=A0A5N6RGG4_9ROSI|nr:hypothetical protein FH972_016457 [Carpinus fangiana]